MTITTELNLVADTKPVGANVVVERRKRVAKAITTQINQVNSDIMGEDLSYGRKSPSWVWMEPDSGAYFVSIKYGKQALELSKGKYAVTCESLEAVSDALEVLKGYVLKGEFDAKLDGMAKSIRRNFKR